MDNNPTDMASICSNPNAMIALVHSARLGRVWIPVDREFKAAGDFGTSRQPQTLRAASSHIRDLMDALAGLSLSNEQNPSIACAMTVDDSEQKVEIVIASSNQVTHRTQEHIRKVWEDMVEISALTRYSRHEVGEACEKRKSRALIRSIYEFCMPTFSKNFLDNISRLRAGVSKYEKWHQEQVSKKKPSRMDDPRSLATDIKEILQDLSAYEDAVAMSFVMTDHETLDKFISTMNSVLYRTTKLLALDDGSRFKYDWNPIYTLGDIVNPYYMGCLRHILEDLISFPKNIERLRKFYFSHHFAHISNYEIQIRPLNNGKYEGPLGPWPSTSLDWKEVCAYLHREKGYRFVGSEAARNFSNILTTDPTELVVHPELKIAIYLHTMGRLFAQQRSHYTGTPPFNYISVSELPCRPCVLWLSQANSMDRGHELEVRGSSHKWPCDWRMPAINTEEISRYMKDSAWEEYLTAQTWRGKRNLVPLDK